MSNGREGATGRWLAMLFACAGIVAAGTAVCFLFSRQVTAQQPSAPPAAAAPAEPRTPAVPVSVAKVTRRDVPVWLRGLGAVQALNAVQVRTRVDGTLQQVAVAEGQEVKQGDLLAVIDPRPYQAALDAAIAKQKQDQALLANAQADLVRYTALAQREIASRQKLEAVRMLVNQANAAISGDDALIDAARLNLNFCYITAPFDSRVGLRNVDAGNFVRAAEATPMFSLAQIRPIAATFTVPQDMLPAIQDAMSAGKPTVVAFASDDRTELDKGTLLTLDNAVDATTGTIKLKATFPNQTNRLWPGQFINARLLLTTETGSLTVPTAAVQHGPSGLFVYVVQPDSTVTRQDVELRRDDGRTAIIAKGLEEGQTVVVDGQSRLQAGTRVAASGVAASGVGASGVGANGVRPPPGNTGG